MDAGFIHDLFAEFGPVQVRTMFGGAGVFADGLMFALVVDDVLYLKADEDSAALFERENCSPFSYRTRGGRRTVMSYWRLPDRLYDDPVGLARWAERALAAARAGAIKSQSKKKRKRKARL